MAKCLICHGEARVNEGRVFVEDLHKVKCQLCGEYTWVEELKDYVFDLPKVDRMKLAGYSLERTLLGSPVTLTTEDAVKSAIDAAPTDVLDKFDRLILNLARRTGHLGQLIELDTENEFSLGYCESGSELLGQLAQLRHLDYIESRPTLSSRSVIMSVRGFQRARELRAALGPSSEQGFVAMSFGIELRSCYDNAIEPAIRAARYKPLRLDRDPHNDRIDSKIIVEIKRSRFVVADLTEQKHGVYYEAGFAQGLGLPVIWTCRRKPDADETHFDTRQFNQLRWDNEEELKALLTDHILATIGEGPVRD